MNKPAITSGIASGQEIDLSKETVRCGDSIYGSLCNSVIRIFTGNANADREMLPDGVSDALQELTQTAVYCGRVLETLAQHHRCSVRLCNLCDEREDLAVLSPENAHVLSYICILRETAEASRLLLETVEGLLDTTIDEVNEGTRFLQRFCRRPRATQLENATSSGQHMLENLCTLNSAMNQVDLLLSARLELILNLSVDSARGLESFADWLQKAASLSQRLHEIQG